MSKKRRNPMSGLAVHVENLKTSNVRVPDLLSAPAPVPQIWNSLKRQQLFNIPSLLSEGDLARWFEFLESPEFKSDSIRMKEQQRFLEKLIPALCDGLPPGIFLSVGNVFGGMKKNTPAQRRKARRSSKAKA